MITVPSELAKEIEQMPLLATDLPFEFGGGTISWLTVNCASCGIEIEANSIRGKFEPVIDNTVAKLKAYAVCYKCCTLTPIEAKFHNDGNVLYRTHPNGWIKRRWGSPDTDIQKIMSRWQKTLPPIIAVVVVVTWIIVKLF